MPRYAELIYNGFWFSPEREMLQALIDKSQEHVEGTVRLKLYKGNVIVVGRESPKSLYSEELVTFEEARRLRPEATPRASSSSTRCACATDAWRTSRRRRGTRRRSRATPRCPGCCAWAVEAERLRRHVPVDREAGAAERGRAERAFVQPRAAIGSRPRSRESIST
jgi:hypothetical protein